MIVDGVEHYVAEMLKGRVGRLRLGTVSDLDTSKALDEAVVSGRPMRTLVAVSAGDTVCWWDGPEPWIVGKPYSTP